MKQVISFAASAKPYIASIKHFPSTLCSQNANQVKYLLGTSWFNVWFDFSTCKLWIQLLELKFKVLHGVKGEEDRGHENPVIKMKDQLAWV